MLHPIKLHVMIYTTDKSKGNLHLNVLLEVMAKISIKCIVAREKGQERPAKDVVMELLRLEEKMIEAFGNLFDSREVSSKALEVLFKVIMAKSDDIYQVTTLLSHRNLI